MSGLCVPRTLLLLLLGCTQVQLPDQSTGETTSGRAHDYKWLVAHLRDSGLAVEDAGEIEQPFFTPKAGVVRIGESGEAQIYEYATEQQAAAEAARVNSDGSIGTSMPMWIAPPHFFRNGPLIVLYLGSDNNVLRTLRELLGDQFAGS